MLYHYGKLPANQGVIFFVNSKVQIYLTLEEINWIANVIIFLSQKRSYLSKKFPSPGDLPDPGIKPRSLAMQTDSLPSELPGKPQVKNVNKLTITFVFPFF